MVPGPRARESRSPLDSRGPLPRRQGASSFLRAAARAGVLPGLRRGARSRRHGMSVHAACGSHPLRNNLEGPFLFIPVRNARTVILERIVDAKPSLPLAPAYEPGDRILGFPLRVVTPHLLRGHHLQPPWLPFLAFCIFHTND